ncbi:MAG TPA: aminotransferase class III-fold pyridoxal phosphate-dependent enzyme [Verrucomicrobiales bacterium]|nr:aminotransferase class III-fold pyridoxal phosphate-dependent enzyme [Verrucomicrobiales bacterium]
MNPAPDPPAPVARQGETVLRVLPAVILAPGMALTGAKPLSPAQIFVTNGPRQRCLKRPSPNSLHRLKRCQPHFINSPKRLERIPLSAMMQKDLRFTRSPAGIAGHEPQHFKPRLSHLLQTLRIDVTYERAEGTHLYYRGENGREVAVLDLAGGYGSLLLGHAHPVLVAEAQRLIASRPIHAQGSLREYAARLAAALARRAGDDYCVLFGNSGAEAVEAAMKHAMLETGGRTFIALQRAFHGKTLGALQLTANPDHRQPFDLSGVDVVHVPSGSIEDLEAAFAASVDLAGFVFEPILGEGGVRPVDPDFARRAACLCAERNVPLIADECQTGLGRTGAFLACQQLGIQPDYLVLAKALGGGIAKISATLIRRKRYLEEFELKHTSTFADDDFSCGVALKTLELIDEGMLARCAEQGEKLIEGLRDLAEHYPAVIAGVRGRGLMIGVEFRRPVRSRSFLLRFLGAQEELACVIMGYLLNVHRIRVAPTLSDPFTLRLQPPALLDDREIERTRIAFDDVCRRLAEDDSAGLTRFFTGGTRAAESSRLRMRSHVKFAAYDEPAFRRRLTRSPAVKVGWLCHLVDDEDFVKLEPGFARLSSRAREELLEHLAPRMGPVLMGSAGVRSRTGDMVCFYPILLPITSGWIRRRMDLGEWAAPRALVQMGVDFARSLHCSVLSLGQYTSIVTQNGLKIASGGIGITSGNSYAVALALEAIARAHRETATDSRESVLVVAGAGGNIGRICAELLAPRYRRTILVGSAKPGARLRLAEFARRIPNATATTDPETIRKGSVVLAALNAIDAPLTADHFGHGAIVCDLSVPAALPPGVRAERSDLVILKGGIAALPGGEDLDIAGFPLPPGQVYGCMAEALLLGLEGAHDSAFVGSLSEHHVRSVAGMAQRHGFCLADPQRSSVTGVEAEEEAYAIAL